MTCGVLVEVGRERERQDAKWGVQDHPLDTWMTILMEEVGELAQAALHDRFGGKLTAADARAEAVQVAAVSVAIIESIDRQAAP